MIQSIEGTFDVTLTRRESDEGHPDAAPSRMGIEKRFHGGLDATSVGQMLSVMTQQDGSAGYVAMELVTGSLDGKAGTFVLQHSGIMTRGEPTLVVIVVPDSGTGELKDLSGRMEIDRPEDGVHTYRFDYSLDTPQ